MKFAEVALPVPLHHTFTYLIPSGMEVSAGARVLVPFGRRKQIGIVVHIHAEKGMRELKSIELVYDQKPLISNLTLEWLVWASRYYLTPLGEVLSTALPSTLFKIPVAAKIGEKKARVSPFTDHWIQEKEVELHSRQKEILKSLLKFSQEKPFFAALLFGVTGSGKTEIYIHFMKEILNRGGQVIFLVPEIGLTPQVVGRLKSFFGDQLALYHSGLTENQRLEGWLRAQRGEVSIIVGTRSALFIPFNNLGAIIIDEEHDGSYKQDERFRYHARDMSVMRGKIENATVLMGSATPSLESFQNVREGKYHLYSLTERATESSLPKIDLIDMAAQKRQTNLPLGLCKELHRAIDEALKKKEQVMIFLNRRGFSTSFFCLQCEKSAMCPNCSVNFTYHKKNKILLCHYCDVSLPLPKKCPSCHSVEVTLLGVGTESIEEELKTFFPKARIDRLDRDAVRKKGVLLKTLKNLREGKIDILVGTQMIAKGHDIPNITLVGVAGGDSGLGLPDFRSSERTFQLLTQVAGRAGRGSQPGRVIIQTYSPGHYSIQLSCQNDYEAFFEKEMEYRRELSYPPVGRLIQFRFSSTSQKKIEDWIQHLEKKLPRGRDRIFGDEVHLLGPAPAPLQKVRGRHRWQLLLKGKNISSLKKAAISLMSLFEEINVTGVKWAVDVDPIAML